MSESQNVPAVKKTSGEPIFRAKTLVITEEHGGKDDKASPDWGRLSPSSIAKPTGLASSLPGSDVKVVHGDYNEHLCDNKNTNVFKNETLNVMADQFETIQGATKLTYVHGRDAVIGDEDQIQVNGIQKTYVLGESEERYMQKHEVHAPEEFELKHFERGLTYVEFKLLGVGASVKGRESEVKVSGDENALYESFMKGFHEKANAQKAEAEALSDKAAITADANARVNALPDVGVGTPIR